MRKRLSNGYLDEPMTVVDVFSGCGGMSVGFQSAGFDVLAAFDHWGPAVEVYRRNFVHPVFQRDLALPGSAELVASYSPMVLIGGPPCQDFSSAGPRDHNSTRAGLFERFIDFVEVAQPPYFVLENVPRSRLTKIFSKAIERVHAIGYGLTVTVLDAAFFGVPQTRKRLFVIGGKHQPADFLIPFLASQKTRKPLTMREYFGDALGVDYYFRVPTNYRRRGVFSVDEPCATIRAVDRPIPKGYPRHPDDPVEIGGNVRGLSVLERARVQTFPESFVFEGTKSNLNTMIGNAVPVKLAENVARALKEYMRKENAKH